MSNRTTISAPSPDEEPRRHALPCACSPRRPGELCAACLWRKFNPEPEPEPDEAPNPADDAPFVCTCGNAGDLDDMCKFCIRQYNIWADELAAEFEARERMESGWAYEVLQRAGVN